MQTACRTNVLVVCPTKIVVTIERTENLVVFKLIAVSLTPGHDWLRSSVSPTLKLRRKKRSLLIKLSEARACKAKEDDVYPEVRGIRIRSVRGTTLLYHQYILFITALKNKNTLCIYQQLITASEKSSHIWRS
jgi:hypothetical protein